MQPKLMTSKETADSLRVTVRTLMKWKKLGKGPPCHKLGNRLRYDAADVAAWLKSQPEK